MTRTSTLDSTLSQRDNLTSQLRVKRQPVILSGVTRDPLSVLPRQKPPSVEIRKTPGTSLGSANVLGEIWGNSDLFTMAILEAANIDALALAFYGRDIEFGTEDFSDGVTLTMAIGASSQSVCRKHKFRKRTSEVKTSFMTIPPNPVDSVHFKTGVALFQNLGYLLYMVDNHGWPFKDFPDMVMIPCFGTVSTFPGRAFVITMSPPVLGKSKAKVVIRHARFGDRLQNVLVLEQVPKTQ